VLPSLIASAPSRRKRFCRLERDWRIAALADEEVVVMTLRRQPKLRSRSSLSEVNCDPSITKRLAGPRRKNIVNGQMFEERLEIMLKRIEGLSLS
jgi:hypothetical protein